MKKKRSIKKEDLRKIKSSLLMALWTGVALIACQFLTSYLMYFLLGAERLQQPLWTTIYSAVVYSVWL